MLQMGAKYVQRHKSRHTVAIKKMDINLDMVSKLRLKQRLSLMYLDILLIIIYRILPDESIIEMLIV